MSKKVQPTFECKACDYSTSSKRDYEKHLATRKHLSGNKYVKIQPKSPLPFTCVCGRTYKHRGSLYNHRKKCQFKNAAVAPVEEKTSKDPEKEWLKEQIEEMRELMKMMIPKMGDQVIKDNKIAVNVFLNEQCKDAVNFADFVDQITVSIDDLLLTKQIGYSGGVSNILIKHLNGMQISDRPIHCSDHNRMKFHVKEVCGWNEDNGQSVDSAIATITQKQIATIKRWETAYPKWDEDPRQTEEYATMVRRVMGGSTDEEVLRNKKEIVRNVGDAVDLGQAIIPHQQHR